MIRKSMIVVLLLASITTNLACAAASDTKTKTIIGGVISTGTIISGSLVTDNKSTIKLPLSDAAKYKDIDIPKEAIATLKNAKIKDANITEGSYKGDIASGTTVEKAKLTGVEIEKAAVTFSFKNSSGVAMEASVTGALSGSEIDDATITNAVISKSTPSTPVSTNDNYLGDCFKVFIPTKDTSGNLFGGGRNTSGKLLGGGWYLTSSQDKDTDKVHLLKVNSPNGILCSADDPLPIDEPEQVTASANELMANGALRSGWVYGALVLPYKYHPDDKSFSSETSIGPYVGRRSTLGALSYIWAVTAGLTPLSVESVDQDGNKKTTNLAAFTYAAGLMFEFNKGASPFRAGIFFGRDIVSSDSAVTYKHDRKNWLAFQLGWDFVAK